MSSFDKNRAIAKAKSLAKSFKAEEAKRFISNYKNAKWYDDFTLLYNMIIDKNFKIDKKVYFTIAGVLAYVVTPIDTIPDFIPITGFVDDMFVIEFFMNSISQEIERYKEYIKTKKY